MGMSNVNGLLIIAGIIYSAIYFWIIDYKIDKVREENKELKELLNSFKKAENNTGT